MRLASYEVQGHRTWGALVDGQISDARSVGAPESVMGALSSGIERWLEPVSADRKAAWYGLQDVRLCAPLTGSGKIVAVGLNYRDHAVESGAAMPKEPLLFAKFPSAIIGPNEPICWNRALTDQVDFEAELAVVIGRRARDVGEAMALSHVLGYTCLNDVSARDLQFRDGQWVRGKSLDSFCPIGPWIVTADEVGDAQALAITCSVSGQLLQSATTADMYFGVAELISWISRNFTLEPGDLIATGSPPGVGYFREPKRLLRDGDVVTVAIERVGELRNPCRTTGRSRPAEEPSAT